MAKMSSSPYLNDPQRVADVIAAIQVMAVYKFYKLDFARWAERISADSSQASHWQKVFEEHPEFFRLDTKKAKASLVWRRQHPKRYHVDKELELSKEELTQLLSDEKDSRVSRRPLSPDDINTLITTAINLHSRALEEQKERRWWYNLIVTVFVAIASLIGAAIGGYLSAGR
ncbi:hypothetical protein C5S42_00275 [Candidatus Methanomarinus sp.]|nr:hypothetical protein C5S42_00275 [ANME-2 cluster archaeon]